MKTTKRFYEQAQKAAHLIYVGHYYPTLDDAYKNGGSAEKRRAFKNLYYRFIDLQMQRKIKIQRMGIISANTNIFTFACLFTDKETGVLKCYYTTPYNEITVDYGTSWEDFKREQKRKGLQSPLQNRIGGTRKMKSNKRTQIFDFTLLQEYQEYDRRTEMALELLMHICPTISHIINYPKTQVCKFVKKIMYIYIYRQLAYVFYVGFDDCELSLLAKRICTYLFEGTEEYRYRKQFAK